MKKLNFIASNRIESHRNASNRILTKKERLPLQRKLQKKAFFDILIHYIIKTSLQLA